MSPADVTPFVARAIQLADGSDSGRPTRSRRAEDRFISTWLGRSIVHIHRALKPQFRNDGHLHGYQCSLTSLSYECWKHGTILPCAMGTLMTLPGPTPRLSGIPFHSMFVLLATGRLRGQSFEVVIYTMPSANVPEPVKPA